MIGPIKHNIVIDLQRPGAPQIVYATQGDEASRQVVITLYDSGAAWPVPETVTKVFLEYSKADGHGGVYDKLPDGTQAYTIAENTVAIMLAPQVLTCAGLTSATAKLIDADGAVLQTFPFQIRTAAAPESAASEDYSTTVTMAQLQSELETVKSNYIRTVNGKQRDSAKNVELAAGDIKVEVQETQYQGDVAGALSNIAAFAAHEVVKVEFDNPDYTASATFSAIRAAHLSGKSVIVEFNNIALGYTVLLRLSACTDTVVEFTGIANPSANEYYITNLWVTSGNVWGSRDTFIPLPTRVVLTVAYSAGVGSLQSVSKNGLSVSFTEKDYSTVLAALKEALNTGGTVALMDGRGNCCNLSVMCTESDATCHYCDFYTADAPDEGFEQWRVYITASSCDVQYLEA